MYPQQQTALAECGTREGKGGKRGMGKGKRGGGDDEGEGRTREKKGGEGEWGRVGRVVPIKLENWLV